MDADGLIAALGYGDAPGFLGRDRWSEAIDHAHVFRHTERACAKVGGRFRGVYMLGLNRARERSASTPVVYVCEAHDEEQAEAVHRLAWNQSAAPFVLVHMPAGVRLYSGFDYEPRSSDVVPESQRGVLEACVAFDDVATKLAAFRAVSVDDGTLWASWGRLVNPTRRVDVQLLKNLAALARSLHVESGLELPVAHALIGRFVYLRYLRERGLLTDKRIESWELDPAEVFGRSMGLKSFHALGDRIDSWLNGAIFPVSKTGDDAPRAAHVRRVAAVMLGDDASSGQGHLPFRAYDFSHIPIELISSIYEQFIAGEGRDAEAGAYYTPIPLVNFVLGELDDMHPLREGMRVCDPSCGSGAFLVQCYVGTEGLGGFLDGTYVPEAPAAAMLGFVQRAANDDAHEKVHHKLTSERPRHGLPTSGAVWADFTFHARLGTTRVSVHQRQSPLRAIQIYHSFLRCRP